MTSGGGEGTERMAEAIFWTALAGIAYVYAGYPLLLLAWRT